MPVMLDTKLIKRSGIFRGRRVVKGGRLVEIAEHFIKFEIQKSTYKSISKHEN